MSIIFFQDPKFAKLVLIYKAIANLPFLLTSWHALSIALNIDPV